MSETEMGSLGQQKRRMESLWEKHRGADRTFQKKSKGRSEMQATKAKERANKKEARVKGGTKLPALDQKQVETGLKRATKPFGRKKKKQ